MKSFGLDFSRQTMSSSCIQAAKVLQPLYELMRQDIIKRNIIFTDDTGQKAGQQLVARIRNPNKKYSSQILNTIFNPDSGNSL